MIKDHWKVIKLTQNKWVMVDAEDYDELSKYKWALIRGTTGVMYAQRHPWDKKTKKQNIERMHRTIMKAKKGQEIDHVNGNGLDNRKSNLRFCTQSQNCSNSGSRGGTSRFKGVSFNKRDKNWKAYIMANSKNKNLGYFKLEEDAARAYDEAAKKHHGEFAWCNFK